MRDIKIDIKTDAIQALLEGKKVIFDYQGQPRVILYPDRYGVFITHEKFAEMRRRILISATSMETDEYLRECFGDEMYEKVMNK